MFARGVLELALLNLLALAAAMSVAARVRFEGRAERALATGILWNAIVLVPIYVLALPNLLTPSRLAVISALFSSIVLAASTFRRRPADVARELLRHAWHALRLPFDGIREAWSARSIATIGVIFAA